MAHIPENDNWVFLLGAGFSAEDFPVMNQFMESARKLYFTKERECPNNELVECHRTLLQFQDNCLKSSWAFNRNWENIEELYTQADLLRLAGRKGADELCNKTAWSIWDVYRGKPSKQLYLKAIAEKLGRFGLQPVFITTNYDVSIELQLGNLSEYYYPGFETRPEQKIFLQKLDVKPPAGPLPIIKLHGSANWFKGDDEGRTWVGVASDFDDTHPIAHHSGTLDLSKYKSYLRDSFLSEVRSRDGNQYTPAIIPPMLGKASVSPVIAKQWGSAIEAVAKARQIWIIGYSFPATDTFMLRLLSAGIEANPNLQKIVIIDWELYTDWKDRLEGMFSPMTLKHRVDFFSADAKTIIWFLGEVIKSEDPSFWASLAKKKYSESHINARLHEKRLKDASILV